MRSRPVIDAASARRSSRLDRRARARKRVSLARRVLRCERRIGRCTVETGVGDARGTRARARVAFTLMCALLGMLAVITPGDGPGVGGVARG